MTETNSQVRRRGGLRAAVARRVDRFALTRAGVIASRSARGKYSPDESREIERRVASMLHVTSDDPTQEYVEGVAAAYEGLWNRDRGWIADSDRLKQATVDQFHRLYYHSQTSTWTNTYYRGVTIWKCPLDVWIYQEILHEVQPDLIIETGTAFGGSAYYLGDLCDSLGKGRIVSIDIKDRTDGLAHPRVEFIRASSTNPDIKRRVMETLPEGGKTLVILDSDHSRDHVLAEMRLWHDVVTPGSYMIVEDGNINGHPARADSGPGPYEAIQTFMKTNDDFFIDESKHKFFMTLNPNGYLKKKVR